MELTLPDVVVDIWSRYQQEIWMLGVASAAMLVISAALIPYLIVRLPADFYAESNHRRRLFQDHRWLRIMFLTVKNAVGGLLLVAGILMLVLPGPGLLTILAALALLNVPGKRALAWRILHRPALLKSINWLRQRTGRKPLSF